VRPDVAVELAWRNHLTDFAMPYLIQYISNLHDKVKELDARTKPPAKDDEQAPQEQGFLSGPGATFMLANQAFNQPGMDAYQQQQYMMQMQQQQQQHMNGGMYYQ
jgi:clathrin heavy chain